jgi:predicted ArsR family transcriptional regulator
VNPTQKSILDYLQKHSSATAQELCQLLLMTTANVRYHLIKLQQAGQVEYTLDATRKSRGHPVYSYRLRETVRPNNLLTLADALLIESMEGLTAEQQIPVLRKLSTRVISIVNPKPATTLRGRLSQAVAALNRSHYQAKWEARADGAHIILAHCPYSALLDHHPELCQMDSFIVEQLLAGRVNPVIRRIDRLPMAGPCVFSIPP